MSSIVRSVVIFAREPKVVAQWWADFLGLRDDDVSVEENFAYFDVGGIEFGFHPADERRNPIGGSPVVYLRVDDHASSLARAESKGARVHRGPLRIGPSRTIAQLVDPFGTVFGLDGP